jgi:Cof subfamily protein (haloacid dehalogenase superfamily)
MYKAVFLDLDGTLLRDDHSISEETRAVVQKLAARGVLIVLVSARPIHGIIPISNWLGIHPNPLVSVNGAYIVENDEVVFQSGLDLDTVQAIHAANAEPGATLIYYNGLQWYAEVSNAATTKEQRVTEVPVIIEPFETFMNDWKSAGTHPNKVMAIASEQIINELQSKLLVMFKDSLNIYTSKPTYLEIMRRDASKTNALKFLTEKYNIKQDEVIAIGDNYNDKEMIMYAGLGIAMGNAPDPIKDVAGYVTDTNEQDGVRKALEKFFEL